MLWIVCSRWLRCFALVILNVNRLMVMWLWLVVTFVDRMFICLLDSMCDMFDSR